MSRAILLVMLLTTVGQHNFCSGCWPRSLSFYVVVVGRRRRSESHLSTEPCMERRGWLCQVHMLTQQVDSSSRALCKVSARLLGQQQQQQQQQQLVVSSIGSMMPTIPWIRKLGTVGPVSLLWPTATHS